MPNSLMSRPIPCRTRRSLVLGIGTVLAGTGLQAATPPGRGDWGAVRPGTIVLFRHALAPGTGDPPNFKLGDCSTQRNLSAEGRAQASRLGEAFRTRGIQVGGVLSSQWCRCRDTADIAFPGQRRDETVFNSFFQERDNGEPQTRAARALLSAWRGPGVLVVVTHQVNVTALTQVFPESGEGFVLRPSQGGIELIGRVFA